MMTERQGVLSTIRVVRGQHAFVTGATGFVGGHVARALSSEGWQVKALVRHGGNAHRLKKHDLAVEIVPGDITMRTYITNTPARVDALGYTTCLVPAPRLYAYTQV